MPFPVTLVFNKRLQTAITADKLQQALGYVRDQIVEKRTDKVRVDNNTVYYQGTTGAVRGSLFGFTGCFTIINKATVSYLSYELNLRRLFIITGLMSAAMGLYAYIGAHVWWVGIAAFSWLCGMNWVIIYFRHEYLAARLAAGIDQLFGNYEAPVKDDGKLKSWM